MDPDTTIMNSILTINSAGEISQDQILPLVRLVSFRTSKNLFEKNLESLISLRSAYAGYQEAMAPGVSRANHVTELIDLFKVHGTEPDVSTWGDQEFNCILKNIHDLESDWGLKDVSNREVNILLSHPKDAKRYLRQHES